MTNEELKRAAGIMYAAHAGGVTIQYRPRELDHWLDIPNQDLVAWNWSACDYRIKPTKTFRPWKPDEVPINAWFRTGLDSGLWFKVCQFNAVNGTITNHDDDGWTPGEALAGLSHSADGGKTWLRCGVEVEQ